MLWSRISISSCAIQDEEGAWVATCINADVAGEMLDLHNFKSDKICTLSTDLSTAIPISIDPSTG
jgi:hypothetical protein